MPEIHPSLLIVQEAELDGEVLESFAPPVRQRRFSSLAEIRKDIEGSVLVVTPKMAQEASRDARPKMHRPSLPSFSG
jgi:hypothetical protein